MKVAEVGWPISKVLQTSPPSYATEMELNVVDEQILNLRARARQGNWQLQHNRNFRENRRFQAGNWFPD
jgi:transposase